MAVSDDSSGGLKTVERALRVLEIVAAAGSPPSVKAVSDLLGHNLSSTYNIVNTLLSTGYLTKDALGNLRIGVRVALLHSALQRGDDYLELVKPLLNDVAASSNETVYLTKLVGNRVQIREVIEGRQSLRVSGLSAGFHGAEDNRASGKAVMAFMPDERVLELLHTNHPEESDQQIARRHEELRPLLMEAKSKGYAVDNEDFEPGICCIAAPYFEANGSVAGSLAVSGPAVRSELLFGRVQEHVVDTAAAISAVLGAGEIRPRMPEKDKATSAAR